MATTDEKTSCHFRKRDFQRRESLEGGKLKKVSDRYERTSPFPPYFTVDELWMYRKKRPDASWLRDNLKLEKGSFKYLKTEYMRRFKNFYELLKAKNGKQPISFHTYPIKPVDSLKLEGDQEFNSRYKESNGKKWISRLDNLHMDYETIHNDSQEHQSVPIKPMEYGRQLLRRRPTTLKLEGEHYYFTEYTDRFMKYAICKRAQLLRTPTHLKMEGGMEDQTENREMFVKYDHVGRPPLCKKFTQLHLEGSFDFSTDNMRSYPLHQYQQPPCLVRKSTNLNLEGDLTMTPEYTREYVGYSNPDRSKPIVPRNNLKTSGLVDRSIPEEKFTTKLQPLIPFLREAPGSRDGSRPTSRTSSRRGSFKEERHIPTYAQPQPNLIITSASETDLAHVEPDHIHNAYLQPDTYRDAKKTRSRRGQYSCMQPEYADQYLGFPKTRIWKPPDHLSSPGKMVADELLYSPRRRARKKEPVRRDSDFLLEENFECQPEYRKACRDMLIRSKPPLEQRKRAVQNIADAEKSPPLDERIESKPADTETTSTSTRPKTSKLPEVVPSKKPPIKHRANDERPTKLGLRHLEYSAFGPRTTTIRRSLSSSPVGRSPITIERPSRGTSRSRRKKELDEGAGGSRSRWERRHDVDAEHAAFVVLNSEFGHKKNIKQALYKEQKWMPVWNYSSHSS